ncbi:putative electron transfer flavoprotein FixA [Gordonibacter sp.]|uniref:putative electron transfer flavoprotein FixA n=1 Tax=Gordonibacter sp. TaxID=1968902 RepID=UPI002FCC80DB
MNTVVAFKVVSDDQDIMVTSDDQLDFSKAEQIISVYDLNAIEAAAQVAADAGGSVTAITVGPRAIDNSKLKKNVLSRGIDELYMVADDACANMDAHATSSVLGAMVKNLSFDLIICGDGSADDYAQQVDVQLAAKLDIPVVNGVTELKVEDGRATVKRLLENEIEVLSVPLPAVLSVTPDAALPRIPGMKDILAAGKKPMHVTDAASVPERAITVVECKAPEQAMRKMEILKASDSGAIEQFAAEIKAAL